MTRRRKIVLLTIAIVFAGLALGTVRAHDVPKVVTGFIADVLCAETFVSGLDIRPNLTETIDAMPGASLFAWAMDYRVDRARKDVTVTLFGIGRSHAVYREDSAARSSTAEGSPTSRCRRMTGSRRCCPRSPGPRSCRHRARSCQPHSIAPSLSRHRRHSAAPAQSSS